MSWRTSRPHRRHARLTLAALLVVALVAVSGPPAQAQNALFEDSRVPFGSVNGRVEAIEAVGHLLWVGGQFDTTTDVDLTTTHPRSNLAIFDINTGDVHALAIDANDKVKAIASDGATRVWVAGNFTEIAGQPVTYLASFNVLNGALDPGFEVVLDNELNSVHFTDGWLYIGGDFTLVNGEPHRSMARVDAWTGAVDTAFTPDPNGKVRSIDSHGDRVYAAGYFDEVGIAPDNELRRWIAGFDTATGDTAGPDFYFPPLGEGEAAHKWGLRHVRISDDGAHLYTGDNRNQLSKWNRETGELLWQRETEGDIQGLALDGDIVYAGNHDGFLAKSDERLLFAVDAADGSPELAFEPLLNSFSGTWGLEIADDTLIAGGDFTTVNGESSPHLAVFHRPGRADVDPLPAPIGDANCDGTPTIVDALVTSQYTVGQRTLEASCPLTDPATSIGPAADANLDGQVDIIDALMVAQCSVGIENVVCPGQ